MDGIIDDCELERRIEEARRKKIQSVMEGKFQLARHGSSFQEDEPRLPRHFLRRSHFGVLCDRQRTKMTEIAMEDWE